MKAGRVMRRLCSGEGGGAILRRWDCVVWAGVNFRRLKVVATSSMTVAAVPRGPYHLKSSGNAVSQHRIRWEHNLKASVLVLGGGSYLLSDLLLHFDRRAQFSHLFDPVAGITTVFPQHVVLWVGGADDGWPVIATTWWRGTHYFFKTNALARFLSITALPVPILIHQIIACRISPNHLFV